MAYESDLAVKHTATLVHHLTFANTPTNAQQDPTPCLWQRHTRSARPMTLYSPCCALGWRR